MPLNLVHGPPNSGKRGIVRARLVAELGRDPVLVVPTLDDEFSFERELCRGGAVLGGVAMTFGALFSQIATDGGSPPAFRLSEAQRLRDGRRGRLRRRAPRAAAALGLPTRLRPRPGEAARRAAGGRRRARRGRGQRRDARGLRLPQRHRRALHRLRRRPRPPRQARQPRHRPPRDRRPRRGPRALARPAGLPLRLRRPDPEPVRAAGGAVGPSRGHRRPRLRAGQQRAGGAGGAAGGAARADRCRRRGDDRRRPRQHRERDAVRAGRALRQGWAPSRSPRTGA